MTEPNTTIENTQTEGDCSPATCSPCSCISERDEKLKKQYGLQISGKCKQIQMPEFTLVYGLPLEKSDKTRMKKTDPAFLQISHCPFCGQSLKANDESIHPESKPNDHE